MNLLLRLKAAIRSLTRPAGADDPRPAPAQTLGTGERLLVGRNVLITGAGANIGRGIALEMAMQGANIHFTDLDAAACARLERELAVHPVAVRAFVADVADPNATDALLDALACAGIVIDILVNNVGVAAKPHTPDAPGIDEWRRTFDTNLFGPIHLTQRIAATLRQRGMPGSIIFLTSIHQWAVRFDQVYSSSKAALGMLVRELAAQLAPHGIRVNGIAPGWVAEDADGNPLRHPHTPLRGSSINPCYIGRAAVYLASDHFSRHTTGTTLKIDSGLSLYNHLFTQCPH